jgi:hypothetical protein
MMMIIIVMSMGWDYFSGLRPTTDLTQVIREHGEPCKWVRWTKWHRGGFLSDYSEVISFPLSVSFHCVSIRIIRLYIIQGMNNRPVGGWTSGVQFHPTEMNMNILNVITWKWTRWTRHVAHMWMWEMHLTFPLESLKGKGELWIIVQMGRQRGKIGKVYSFEYNEISTSAEKLSE